MAIKYYDGSYDATSVQLEIGHLNGDGNSATFGVTLKTEQGIEITNVSDGEISFIVNGEWEMIGIINVFKQAYGKAHGKLVVEDDEIVANSDYLTEQEELSKGLF